MSTLSITDAARPRSTKLANLIFGVCTWSAAVVIVATFAWIAGDLVVHGAQQIQWSFLTEPPTRSGRDGGISSILVSTALILGVCLVVSVPLGTGAAVFLAEFSRKRNWLQRWIQVSLDVLAGVPSIAFGLFGNAFFSSFLGMGFSILSGGLTLACMVLPILIRSIEMSLRAVPESYRMAGAALDLSQTRLLVSVLIPAAAPGLLAGLLLGIGRALAETAALIFTSGYVDRMPESLLDSGRSLSIHIYDLAMNIPGGEANAYASALVLIALLVAINGTARSMVNLFAGGQLHVRS